MRAVTLAQVPGAPEVTSVYDLEQAADAFAAFGAGTVGKIALRVA